MRTSGLALIAAAAASLLFACSSAPTESGKQDTSSESDAIAFSTNWKIVGSLDYGQSASFSYSNPPKYRAYKFAGNKGDAVDVWVRSTNGGDSVAWVLDNDLNVVGHNDDADGTTLDSHIKVTLPANASATHYVVVRDYNLAKAKFTVTLQGTPAVPVWETCSVDSDCTAVPQVGCCNNGYKAAVNKHHVKAYEDSFTCPEAHPICPLFIILDTRVPACDATSHTCQMITATTTTVCGGIAGTPCPSGLTCIDDPNDACDPATGGDDCPGECVDISPAKACGGISGITCPSGQNCVDYPGDSCDPGTGGADCPGECVTVSSAKTCGGIAGIPCPAGQGCVDNPTDACDPATGGDDCSGICVTD